MVIQSLYHHKINGHTIIDECSIIVFNRHTINYTCENVLCLRLWRLHFETVRFLSFGLLPPYPLVLHKLPPSWREGWIQQTKPHLCSPRQFDNNNSTNSVFSYKVRTNCYSKNNNKSGLLGGIALVAAIIHYFTRNWYIQAQSCSSWKRVLSSLSFSISQTIWVAFRVRDTCCCCCMGYEINFLCFTSSPCQQQWCRSTPTTCWLVHPPLSPISNQTHLSISMAPSWSDRALGLSLTEKKRKRLGERTGKEERDVK